jgi:membrane-bound lytic murein transglycosylase A
VRSIIAIGILGLGACGSDKKPAAAPADARPGVVAAPVDGALTAAPAPDAAPASDTAAAPCPEGPAPTTIDHLTLTKVAFSDLPSWTDDKHAEAIPAFLASCTKLAALADNANVGVDGKSGKAKQWRAACAAAARVPAGDDAAARAFFEAEFVPYAGSADAGPEGKFTGYYVQELRGSRTKHGAFQHPIYARPPDLVQVDLEDFLSDARGRHVWGKVDDRGVLRPYPEREELRTGLLDGKGLEILYVDDRVDAMFLHIEGSGKVVMDDGSTVWLEFDGKNGRRYKGMGKILRDMGEPPGTGTMPGIRKWIADHPDRFDEIADQNEAFVFFKESSRPGAVGSQMVILTDERSLAVDRAFVAASTPIWVQTKKPTSSGDEREWHHLLVAQDTGGGIKGPVRGDIYWGDGADAAQTAGRMGGPGRWWLLLPRSVKVK